jgi:uncharacterized protein YggT (Ycf19 family)
MAEQFQQTTKQVIHDDGTSERISERTSTGVQEEPATTDSTVTAARVIWYMVGAIATILAIRFGLSLLGANRGNPFADLIYTISYPFVAPFFGLFGYQVSYGVSRFEIETLVAIAIYVVLGYGLVRLVTINRRDRDQAV